MYMDSINATCHRYYFLALGIDNRCQPILPADINTREDDFFSRPEVTIYIYISRWTTRCLVKTRRFDGLRGEVRQKLETPFSAIRYLSIDEGTALG